MQHLVIVSELLYWVPLAYILLRFGTNRHSAISDHVASGTPRKIYNPTAILSMTLFLIFCYGWLFPEYEIGPLGYILIGIAYVGMVITTFLPRISYLVPHDMSAGLAGSAISFILLLFVFNDNVTEGVRMLIVLTYAIMAITGPFMLHKHRKNFFMYQLAYFLSFHICIVFLAYS